MGFISHPAKCVLASSYQSKHELADSKCNEAKREKGQHARAHMCACARMCIVEMSYTLNSGPNGRFVWGGSVAWPCWCANWSRSTVLCAWRLRLSSSFALLYSAIPNCIACMNTTECACACSYVRTCGSNCIGVDARVDAYFASSAQPAVPDAEPGGIRKAGEPQQVCARRGRLVRARACARMWARAHVCACAPVVG